MNFSVEGPNVSDSSLDASLSGDCEMKMSSLDLHTISDSENCGRFDVELRYLIQTHGRDVRTTLHEMLDSLT